MPHSSMPRGDQHWLVAPQHMEEGSAPHMPASPLTANETAQLQNLLGRCQPQELIQTLAALSRQSQSWPEHEYWGQLAEQAHVLNRPAPGEGRLTVVAALRAPGRQGGLRHLQCEVEASPEWFACPLITWSERYPELEYDLVALTVYAKSGAEWVFSHNAARAGIEGAALSLRARRIRRSTAAAAPRPTPL